MTTVVLRILSALKLTEVTTDPATGAIVNTTNLTILNFFLLRFGPMTEKRLVQVLICSQVCRAELFEHLGRNNVNQAVFARSPGAFLPFLLGMLLHGSFMTAIVDSFASSEIYASFSVNIFWVAIASYCYLGAAKNMFFVDPRTIRSMRY
jgi:hypothetical protein